VRALPLTALITETWNRTLSYFADRVQVANALVDMNKPWCKKMQRYMDEKAEKSRSHGCSLVDALKNKWLINVRAKYVHDHHKGARKHAITLGLNTCECTYNKPKLLGYPCSHVLRTAAEQKISVEHYIYLLISARSVFLTPGMVSSGPGA
jgi:hypothetical protein